jgi:hypothetical protein
MALVQKIDGHDVAFIVGGVLFVAGIGMLKLAAGVIVCGLLVMAASYFSATPEQPKENHEQQT